MKQWIYALVLAVLAASISVQACAAPAPAPTLADWEGNYKWTPSYDLTILPAGKFKMIALCDDVQGDVIVPVTLTGSASMRADGWIILTAQQKTLSCPVPARYAYYGVRVGTSRILMTHRELLSLVNQLNAGGLAGLHPWGYLREAAPSQKMKGADNSSVVDPTLLMPPPYRAKLRREPLVGAVVRIVPMGSKIVNFGGWMQAPDKREQFSSRATINRGSRHGVFVGMNLFHLGAELTVERVRDDESDAIQNWLPPALPYFATGMPVSSRRSP